MIIRLLFLCISFLVVDTCMSQEKIYCDTLFDMDGIPLSVSCDSSFHGIEYLTLEGEKIIFNETTHLHIEFREGRDSLVRYVKARYYTQDNYDYKELNQRVFFFILFDSNLNIVEVRQLPPFFIHNRIKYEELFKRILKGTYGMWKPIIKGKDWYLYPFITHIF